MPTSLGLRSASGASEEEYMGVDTLIVALFIGGFLFFILLVSPLGDKLRNIAKSIRRFWKASEK